MYRIIIEQSGVIYDCYTLDFIPFITDGWLYRYTIKEISINMIIDIDNLKAKYKGEWVYYYKIL